MLILGIHSGFHDGRAAVFEDYRMLSAVALERLTRVKIAGDKVRATITGFFITPGEHRAPRAPGGGVTAPDTKASARSAGVNTTAAHAPFMSRRWASRYFSAVLATISAGSSGAGGFLFQPMRSR